MKRGLQLDRVVLLGRTLEEYRRYFALDLTALADARVLDIAGGVSSFCAEANERGIRVTAADPIYGWPAAQIAERSAPDLDAIFQAIRGLPTYRWTWYRDEEQMKQLRREASATFLADFPVHPERYVPAALPKLPFADRSFDVTLVSYFLFVYQDQFNYEFHRDSVREIMRVTRGEARIYPTVTFEAEPSVYLDQLRADPELAHLQFKEVKTDFEFLLNSNSFLRITHRV